MRRPLVAVFAIFLVTAAAERVMDDTDENSEDIFERPPRLESSDDTPPDEFGVSPLPGEIQFHRRGHAGFGVADDAEEAEENQGSDGFPRMTAMVDEPAIGSNATTPQQLPLPTENGDRPLDGTRTETRSGTKVVVPFPTLLANNNQGEKETIIELTIAPNTSMSGFGTALAEAERAPVMEYDIEESAGKSDEEEMPVERNLTAAVVFQSTTTVAPPTTLTTTETVTPDASHFPTRDRAGIFPSESTEQLTSHGRPTEHPSPVHVTTKTADTSDSTDPPFAMVDPTIFNPDHLFAVPGAPGIEEKPKEAKEEIDDEDFELKASLSNEAHLDTSTVESIMTSIASTLAPSTEQEMTTMTTTTTAPSTTTSSATVTASTTTATTTAEPVELPTTTPFQLPPLIVSSTTVSPPTTTESTTMTSTTTSTPSTTTSVPTSNFPEEPVHMHGEHEGHRQTPSTAEEVHFEDRPVDTTESMPFDPTAAHFGDSQEDLWMSTHGQQEIAETTTTEPLIAHKTPFHIMVKDLDYMPDFADPDSGKFRKLRDQLLPDLRRHLEKVLRDFIAVDLSSVEKERGVVVHGVVYTRNSIVDLYETANKVEAELELVQMRLGGNEVQGGTFTINGINARAPVERVQQSAASADGSIAFIIAGIITIGVIVILIVVFVIILTKRDTNGQRTIALFMNNHRRGVGSIKLKEDAEAEAGRRAQMHYGNVNLMSYNSPPPPQPPSTQLLQSLPHVVINTKSGSRPSSTMTSPTTPRANMMH